MVLRDRNQVRVWNAADATDIWGKILDEVDAVEVIDERLLVGTDMVRAFDAASGRQLWKVPVLHAQLARVPGRFVVAAGENGIAELNPDGSVQWATAWPAGIESPIPQAITVDNGVAYIGFQPRRSGDSLETDILAVAIEHRPT